MINSFFRWYWSNVACLLNDNCEVRALPSLSWCFVFALQTALMGALAEPLLRLYCWGILWAGYWYGTAATAPPPFSFYS